MRRMLILAVSALGILAAGALTPLGSAIGASSATPTATTGDATNVSQTLATLNGTVNPNGTTTTYVFQYGTTTAYGNTSSTGSAGSGTTPVAAARNVGGLAPGTTYHYRIVATNTQNKKAFGLDRTFTTQTTLSRVALFGHTAFTSPSHVLGVFVGCFGASTCSGSLTITASGRVIARRSSFTATPNNGGIVHLSLNRTGQVLLSRARAHHLRATATVNGTAGAAGSNASTSITIVPFS